MSDQARQLVTTRGFGTGLDSDGANRDAVGMVRAKRTHRQDNYHGALRTAARGTGAGARSAHYH